MLTCYEQIGQLPEKFAACCPNHFETGRDAGVGKQSIMGACDNMKSIFFFIFCYQKMLFICTNIFDDFVNYCTTIFLCGRAYIYKFVKKNFRFIFKSKSK